MARRLSLAIFAAGACGLLLGSLVTSGGRRIAGEQSSQSEPDEVDYRDLVLSPPRGRAIEPMTRAVLIRRSLETFPAGYLTIIGIIQGVALGILVEQAHPLILDAAPPGDRAVALSEFLVAFTTILVTNTLIRCTPEAFAQYDVVFKSVRTLLKRQIGITLLMTVAIAAGTFTGERPQGALAATLPWAFTLGAAGMVLLAERTLHVVYKEYRLPRGNRQETDEPRGAGSS